MDSQNIRVMVVIPGHWLVGTLPATGTRVQEMLTDVSTEYLRLRHVQICRSSQHRSHIATVPQIVVCKQHVQLVVMLESEHEAPIKRFNNFASKPEKAALTIVGGKCIAGTVHLAADAKDPLAGFTAKVGRFFPITNASLDENGCRLTAPLVFANRDFVNGIYVDDEAGSTEQRPPCWHTGETAEESVLNLLESLQEVVAPFAETSGSGDGNERTGEGQYC